MNNVRAGALDAFGYWWVPADPAEKIAGQVTWESLRTPRLSLLDPPQNLWQRSPDPSGTHVPLLHGRLADQGAVTLLDSVWAGMKLNVTQTQKLLVDTVIIGVWLDASDEPFIRRLEVRWPALQALMNGQAVWLRRSPPSGTDEISFSLEPGLRTWDDGEITVTFHNDLRYSTSALAADVRIYPTVILASDEPRSHDWWRRQWLIPLNSLFTIATGYQANPLSIACWETKDPSKDEHLTKRIEVFGQGVGEQVSAQPKALSLIKAEDIDRNDGGIHDVLGRFRRLEQERRVFLELLMDVTNYPDRPLRNRYLDVISSLEAYHTQVHGVGPVDDETYKDQRKAVISAAKQAGLSTREVKFLKDWLPSRPAFSLERRLRAIERRLRLGTRPDPKVTAPRMAELRNLVAHGTSDFTEVELQNAYDEAFGLARRTVLHDLAIDDSS